MIVDLARYDPDLDRLDVGVKAVWWLYQNGKWPILKELGLHTRHGDALREATLDLPKRLTTTSHVFTLLRLCPAVLGPALEALRRYQSLTAPTRQRYYERIAA